jgi:hypothetical protein
MRWALCLGLAVATAAWAQSPCPSTPLYGLCEVALEMTAADVKQHPNPYATAQIHAEFRSPKSRTFRMPGFWDGGQRFVIRFAPDEPGVWTYRLTSNFGDFNGKENTFTAAPSEAKGFIRPANLHHWQWTEGLAPHLWMGDTCYQCSTMDRTLFDRYVEARAAQKFTHVRQLLIPAGGDDKQAFPESDKPNPAYWREVDGRVLALNKKGIAADLILGPGKNRLAELFPTWQQRELYIRYVVARYSAMNVTWQVAQEFETYQDARALMKEMGVALKKLDPYNHPRTTHTIASSAPLLGDGWMNYITYQSASDALGAIEHQTYAAPQVNAAFAYEDTGAGKALPDDVDTDTFRRRMWNATMDGQYPTFGNTGVCGARFAPDAKFLGSPGAKQMTAWFDFLSRTRYWDLEPYYDVTGGRALALPDVEYLVYIEKPGPVEVTVEKHGYDVYWLNPVSGEVIHEKKDFKGEVFQDSPPDTAHDWVLHLSRDGKKEGMLKSYRFEARQIMLQEVEGAPDKLPFELIEPKGQPIAVGKPVKFAVKLKRETRGTRNMLYLLTGEVVRDAQGARALASGSEGTFTIPAEMLKSLPATLSLRMWGLNALGKLYATDQILPLEP